MAIKADKSTEFGNNPKATSVENFVNVDWATFKPTPVYCKSCRASIAQEIRKRLENFFCLDCDLFENCQYIYLRKECPMWQQFWQQYEVK